MNHDALIEIIEREQWEGVKSPAYVALKNSLARQPAEGREPVAYLFGVRVTIPTIMHRQFAAIDYHEQEGETILTKEPLYTHPAPDTVSVPVEPSEK